MPAIPPRLQVDQEWIQQFDNPSLALVITLAEACYMWCKSPTALKSAIYSRRIQGRKSFTGGSFLVLTASMWEVYGTPVRNTIYQLGANSND